MPEPPRDRHGWRSFSESEAAHIATLPQPLDQSAESTALLDDQKLASLGAIDWDFVDAPTGYLTHAIHPYPAKFIPQIPSALIQELSHLGETVLDPFCGSGTTLVESLLLGRSTGGIDANPIAALVSAAKTTRLTEDTAQVLSDLAVQFETQAPTDQLSLFTPSRTLRPQQDEDLAFWFDPQALAELQQIVQRLSVLEGEARVISSVALSSIVVNCSKQDSDTRYVRREKHLAPGETTIRFSRALLEAVSRLRAFSAIVQPRLKATIYRQSVLSPWPALKANLVVTSPPYPNAWSYHLYHRLRMRILGIDNSSFKREEIGSHRKYSSKAKDAATVETFAQEMNLVFRHMSRVLPSGRYACFVIGDSIIRGETVNNTDVLQRAAEPNRFRLREVIHRAVSLKKKSFNPSIGQIRSEHIAIFQRL